MTTDDLRAIVKRHRAMTTRVILSDHQCRRCSDE